MASYVREVMQAKLAAWQPDMHLNIMGQKIPIVVRARADGWHVYQLHPFHDDHTYSAVYIATGNSKAEALNNAIRYLSIG